MDNKRHDPIKFLILEDNPADAELIQRMLKKINKNYDTTIAHDKTQFIYQLENYMPDIILSDFSLRQFNGLEALEIVKQKYPDIPFIIVTGTLDEERAVMCLKEGAWDYVLKHKLFKLEPAIERVCTMRDTLLKKRKAERELKKYEWLLEVEEKQKESVDYVPFYGNVIDLNTERTILDSVGWDLLTLIGADLMALLDTSVAVYEKNGDYAFGMFVSGWCQVMDAASRRLCHTDDNKKALTCGKWLCHENCWNESAKATIISGESTDIHCIGGIKLYAEPIIAGNEIVGAINIGYGNPPLDEDSLKKLSSDFNEDISVLQKAARDYKPRPSFIEEVAKKHLKSAAMLLGNMVFRKRMEERVEEHIKELEIFNDAAVDRELLINEYRKEINTLLKELGRKQKYEIVE